jgi:glycine dehydrogenase subunit 1
VDFIPIGAGEKARMLEAMGAGSFEELLADIPEDLRLKHGLNLPGPLSELEARRRLKTLSETNGACGQWLSFMGGGAYDHYVPSVVDEIASRPEFYTAYTPYQPEVSQGTLQTIYEFQSLVARLTGMQVANASLYDGGTALAEAALMAHATSGRNEIVVSGCLNPMRLAVLDTYLKASGIAIRRTSWQAGSTDPEEVAALVSDKTACVIVENPNFFGVVEACRPIAAIAKSKGCLVVVSVDPISLGILAPPSDYGADIVVGEGQALGNYLSFGGPYLGFMATKKEYIRRLPGRIVGKTVDRAGKTCFCLTLQTREQHIRREKATSNICTNQALVALRAAVYLCWLGKEGLPELAGLCLSLAHYAEQQLASHGFPLHFSRPYFREFVVRLPVAAEAVAGRLARDRILPGVRLGKFYPGAHNLLMIALTEKRTKADVDRLVSAMARAVRDLEV